MLTKTKVLSVYTFFQPHRIWLIAGMTGLLSSAAFANTSAPACSSEKIQAVGRYFSSATEEAPANYLKAYHNFPSRIIPAAKNPYPMSRGTPLGPVSYEYQDRRHSLEDFLASARTSAFLVMKDGIIVQEAYFHGASENTPLLLNSMTKSIVSLLVGIAHDQKLFASVDDPIIKYLPELSGSAYETATIRQVLDMSTSISFPGQDPKATGRGRDIEAAAGRSFACGVSLRGHSAQARMGESARHGEHWLYVNTNTQVLGELVERVSGMTLAQFMEKNLWSQIGAEGDAYWLLDQPDNKNAIEQAWMGLNIRLRDVGRVGQLVAQGGLWQGRQIISMAWLGESSRAAAPFLQKLEERPFVGYSHQWWLPVGSDHEMVGNGFGGQYLYINPAKNVVIVQLSANPAYAVDSARILEETITAFRAIVNSLD